MKPERLARLFKALSTDARVRIVGFLGQQHPLCLCVGALSARLKMTQGAVSQHLKILRDADLVIAERRGYFIHYRLNEKTLARWRETIGRFLGPPGEPSCRAMTPGRKQGGRKCRRTTSVARSRKS